MQDQLFRSSRLYYKLLRKILMEPEVFRIDEGEVEEETAYQLLRLLGAILKTSLYSCNKISDMNTLFYYSSLRWALQFLYKVPDLLHSIEAILWPNDPLCSHRFARATEILFRGRAVVFGVYGRIRSFVTYKGLCEQQREPRVVRRVYDLAIFI